MKKTISKSKFKEIGVLVIIIVMQLLVVLYWSNSKTNYFIDELYSMGYANSFTGKGDTAQYITTAPEFEYNKWISNSIFKKHLILSEDEKFYHANFADYVKKTITGRNYFGLLNIAESLFDFRSVSAIPAVVLNSFFLVIADLLYLTLLKKLNVARDMQFFAYIMFGFSCYIISAALYVRFYMLDIMLMLAMLNGLYQSWIHTEWKKILVSIFFTLSCAFLCYKNSQLTIPFFGAIILCLLVFASFLRRGKQLFTYFSIIVLGLFFLLLRTDYLTILFNYATPSSSVSIAARAIDKLRNISIGDLTSYSMWLSTLFANSYFSSVWVMVLFVGALLFLCLVHRQPLSTRECFCDAKNLRSTDILFMWTLLVATVIFTVFSAACGFMVWRYYCFGFIAITLFFWYMLDAFRKNTLGEDDSLKNRKINQIISIILGCIVVSNAILTFYTRNIEYVYEDEKIFIEIIKENNDLDVLMLTYTKDEDDPKALERHEIYDCVNLMPPESQICFAKLQQFEYDLNAYPERFLLWCGTRGDISIATDAFKSHNYKVEELGIDHCSRVYICERE